MKVYYFDTGIWLDILEERNEPEFPKDELALKLVEGVIKESGRIIYSDVVVAELANLGYSLHDVEEFFRPLRKILEFVEASERQTNRAGDLAAQRNVPKRDALHALIAMDEHALLVTYDKHFQQLRDIAIPHRPQEFIP